MALTNITEHFGSVSLTGLGVNNPTSIQFGHDGRLYVSQQDGVIKAATVQATTDTSGTITGYTVVGDVETIELIKDIPNHDDDGALNTTLGKRQSTGLAVEEGPNGEVVIYVGSSDPRIGGGDKGEKNLDTNSSIISRLTQQPDGSWEKVDLVIGLPRSEENHSINGLDIRTEIVNGEARKIMYITSGGNTNAGAPGNNFEWIPEYYYSAGILRVDLTQLEQMEADLVANGGLNGGTAYVDPYVYALPTLDDPMRANDANGHDISSGTTGPADAEAGSVFGGNDGRNQAKYDANGPVQIYSMGYRNQYDVVITEAGNIYTSDNGPNNGWGSKPITKNDESVTSSSQVASNRPNINVEDGNDNGKDNLHIVTDGFYAGHPNPVYASGAAAGLYTVDESSGSPVIIELTDPSDPNNDPMTTADDLPSDWSTITGGFTHPEAGVYLQPTGSSPILDGSIKGPDGSLLRYGSSTNGLDEYTAAEQISDVANSEIIITSSFNGDVTFAEITSDGTQAGTTVTDVDTYTVGGTPLDLTAVGSAGIDGQGLYAGTIWVAQFGTDTLTVLVPGVAPEPDTDKDDDGIDDIFDPLQDDATNGANTVLQSGSRLYWDFNPSDSGKHPVPSGEFNIGMTGWMTNGTDELSSLRNLDNTIRGGAPGIVQVKNVGVGSAVGTTNNQQDAIQTGFTVDSGVDKFTIKVPVINPFSSDANATVSWYEPASMGFALGDGTQSNFLQIAVVATNEFGTAAVPAIRVTYEENDASVTEFEVAVPGLLNSVDDDLIELFLNVDMQTLQVTPTWRHQTNGAWSNIQQVGTTPVQLTSTGAVAEALQGQHTIQDNQGQSVASGSVVTLTSTASGYEPFTADFLDLTIATPGIVIQETDGKTEVTETGIGDTYSIVLNTPPTSDVTVNLAPNAQIGLDKTTLVFTPSNWGVAQTVTVTAVNDLVEEGDQQVTIGHTVTSPDTDYNNLSVPDLDVTVIDNDAPPLVEINNITVDEDAGTASFTVSLAQASDSQITVDYATADGTALASSDYTATSGTLTFAPGDVNQTVTVNITDDADPESDQTFQVNLSNAVNAVIGDGSGTATIADNDTNVLYRVNVGGDAVAAPDGDVDWTADTAANPSSYRIGNGGDRFYSSVQSVDLSDSSLPAGALDQAIFQTVRHDGKAAPSMQWAFDVEQGSDVEVRLYFSEWWTDQAGDRDFDVAVEGTVPSVFNDIDIAAIAGDKKKGIMLSYFTTVQDDTLNLEFLHGAVSNPWLSGIEVIAAGDVPPAIAIADVTVVDEDAGTATVTIDLSKASTETITVDYTTADGTATAGSDYTAAAGTVTFLPGQTSTTFTVNLLDDTTFEGGETFDVTLSNATGGAVIEDADGSVTILENETPPPAFSVVDVTVDEGSGAATFTVSLSAASSDTLTIDYATADDTATAGSDYIAASGSLTFLPGELTQNVTVDILEDTDFEGDETFTFNLSNVGGDATIADGTAIGTIDENEPSPTGVLYRVNVGGDAVTAPDGDMDWSADTTVNPSTHRVGNGGNRLYSAGGTVDLTNPILPTGALDQSIFQTQRHDGVAAPSMQWAFDVDPGNIEVRLYFAEWWGSGSAGERIFDVAVEGSVPTAFDDIDIADLAGGKKKGTMLSYTTAVTDGTLNLEFLHGSISNPWLSGIEVINIGEVPPAVTIAAVTVDEAAGTATFTATLSKAGTETITVDYATTDGTATAGSDYTAANGTLSFAAGETMKTFTVAIAEDAVYEGDETFAVDLSNVTGGATLGTPTAPGTITDNETPPPSLAIADVTVDEAAGTATFTVNLSEVASQTITVDYTTADDTATAGSDYLATANTLTFLAGETTQTFTVDILDDTDLEGDETFSVNLSGVTGGAIIADGTAIATIEDNDLPASGVLYRVNVGGDAVAAPDSDIAWSADTAANPSTYLVGNGGDKFHSKSNTVDLTSPTLPSGALVQDIFQTSRYDGKAAPNMQWAFDVEAGSEVEVRLYFAEWWTDQAGGRIFDVEVEGSVPSVFDDIDLAAIAGGKRKGFMLSHTTTVADGTLDLEFLHGAVSIPWLSGIEIVAAGSGNAGGDSTVPSVIQTMAEVILTEKSIPQVISVIYSDEDSGLDLTSFGTSDITVTGAATGVQTISANPTVIDNNDGTVTVDYEIAPPGGTWDAAENDTYTIALNANEVFDIAGNAAAADPSLNTFVVDIPTASTPALSIADVTVDETTGTAAFTVSLSAPSASAVTVDFATVEGTAEDESVTPRNDYFSTSGSLTFAANETSKTITVNLRDDIAIEGDETFTVELSNAAGATIADGNGTGTIVENDGTQLSSSLITYNFVGDVSSASSFTVAAEGDSLIGVVATANEEGVAKDVYQSGKGFGVAGELDGTFNDEIDGKGPGGTDDGSGGIEELILTFDSPVKLETVTFKSSSDDDYVIEVGGNQLVAGVAATSPESLPLDVSSLNGTGTEFTFTVASDTGSDNYALAGVQVSAI